MYTMNRCFNARKTRFLAPLPKLAVSTALCLLVATAVWLPNAQAQTAQREFPKNALRAVMVVTSPPQIILNGTSERLSPGARIKGPSNTLLMSGTLTGKEVLVNYVRDHQGMIHEVWVLSELEAQEKRPGMSFSNIIFGSDANKPKTDDGKTPFDQLPKFPAQ